MFACLSLFEAESLPKSGWMCKISTHWVLFCCCCLVRLDVQNKYTLGIVLLLLFSLLSSNAYKFIVSGILLVVGMGGFVGGGGFGE